MHDKYLTTTETAQVLGVSTHRISVFRNYGLLRGTRWGRGWFYTIDDISEFQRRFMGADLTNITDMTVDAVKQKYNL